MKFFLSSLASSSEDNINLIRPSTAHDPYGSPGCTLDVITIAFLLLLAN
jgi:hypothetical protein